MQSFALTATEPRNMHFKTPHWLPGGHLQTIYPALCLTRPTLNFRRERWDTPDGDFIDIDFLDGDNNKPLVVLFHGLEGSSDSHYARALMAKLQSMGWSGAIPHFRGCSGELNRAPRFYHSGDSEEIKWILHKLRVQLNPQLNPQATPQENPNSPVLLSQASDNLIPRKFFACGVSLGGNALLRFLGEAQQQASFIDAACAISAPLDLSAGGAALSKGLNRLYTQMFLRTLKPKCLKKLEQFPRLFDRTAMLEAKNLYEFDNIVTAPLHGYQNTDDYWYRASARHILNDICIPTLVLNARNDPFLPAQFLPQSAAPCVTLKYPEHGGHVGFTHGSLPGNLNWLPETMLQFLIKSSHSSHE